MAFSAATRLLPSQTKAAIQFTATVISEPRVTFFCCLERDIRSQKVFFHAVPKRSESWPQDYAHDAGHVCPCSPEVLLIPGQGTYTLGMCWQGREGCIFLALVGMSDGDPFVEGDWIPSSSRFFARLQKFVDGPAFDMEVVLEEYKWGKGDLKPLSYLRKLDS